MSLPNYDQWLEPPDPGCQEGCEADCILEDPHDTCWTLQDAKDEAALERWEAERDD